MYSLLLILLCGAAPTPATNCSGAVVDAAGQSVAAATVWLIQEGNLQRTETDAQGRFSFSNLRAKPLDLIARKEGSALGGAPVRVPGAAPVEIRLDAADAVHVRIKNAAYEPLAGAFIRTMFVSDRFSVPVEDLAAAGLPAIRSAEDGHLTIGELPKDGHVRFVVGHRDYADASVAYLPVGGKEQTILLYPGKKLRGRVTAQNAGVGEARVRVFKFGSGAQAQAASAVTDREGFYNVTLTPGTYLVAVRHPDYATPKAQQMAISDDAENPVLDFAVELPHVIEGSVLSPDGTACPGIGVSYWIGGDLYEETVTQRDGVFRLQPPGEDGRIHVLPPPGCMTENFGDIKVAGTLPPKMTLAPIKLVALPVVEGVILGEQAGPQPNILIRSLDLQPPIWAITDTAGRFRVQLGEAPAQPKAAFRAEHADRFLRADFEAVLDRVKSVTATLAPFEPDLAARPKHAAENDLAELADKPAPEIECAPWFNSAPVTLESLHGKVVVLTFWSGLSDAGPVRDCIEELRALFDLFKDAQDVVICCVHDSGKDAEEIAESLKSYPILFPVGRDAEPGKTFEAYGIRYIPQTVLIDKHGKLRSFQTEGRLLELIKSLRREG